MRWLCVGHGCVALCLVTGCANRTASGEGETSSTTSVSAGDTTTTTDAGSTTTTDDGPPTTTGGPDVLPTCETLEVAVTSECVVGNTIVSTEYASALCEEELGAGWSWLEFHATEGWFVAAQIHPDAWSTAARAWVSINDQEAECFSSAMREVTVGEPERFGMTWQPLDTNENCWAASCNDPQGLDEPGLDPITTNPAALQCNAYDGDTPCSRCRPLLCVRSI